jgi:hypothetical protein
MYSILPEHLKYENVIAGLQRQASEGREPIIRFTFYPGKDYEKQLEMDGFGLDPDGKIFIDNSESSSLAGQIKECYLQNKAKQNTQNENP